MPKTRIKLTAALYRFANVDRPIDPVAIPGGPTALVLVPLA